MSLPFRGREALIIGGTGGIGRAMALGLAERGARIILHGGSSAERLESALRAIEAAGGEAEGFLERADQEDGAERILRQAARRAAPRNPLGGQDAGIPPEEGPLPKWAPDILVCAWGPFKRAPLEHTGGEDWRYVVTNNLVFPGAIVSLSISSMIRRNWGRILLFGGTNTDILRGYRTSTAYSAAKTALGVVAKSAALTGALWGVTCNVVCPGLTDTEYLDEAERSYNQERSPSGKALKPEDIALAALGIMENPRINGAVVPVDEGLLL
ncbi:MAG: SDR family NAD(P)-dependent oxidoreductase [Treponema sp.]|jgi:3-oxoacyl-[acyl-carrier protein] reductase|nr:SDR family NAD(P)-dependent oxidoreductase [Treponema sp.]